MSADFSPFSTLRRAIAETARAAMLLTAAILLILYREDAGRGVLSGIFTCLNVLIPSLFPFVILSCLLMRSRAVQFFLRPFAFVVRFVFRLPDCTAPVLLFGLTMGYPIGAKLTAALYAEGRLTRSEAARLLCFCTAPGYAFSLYAGTQLGSASCGILLFVSCLTAPLLLGLLLAMFAPTPTAQAGGNLPPYPFTLAVRDGVSAMVSMCGLIVAFSGMTAILQSAGYFRAGAAFLSRLGMTVPAADTGLRFCLEVTGGVAQCIYWHFSPVFAAFGLGFAGLCIQLQIFSYFRKPPLRFLVYFGTRLLNGLLCAAVYTVLSHIFPRAAQAAASGEPLTRATAGSPESSAALLLLSIFFLLFCANRSSTSNSAQP